MIGLGLTDVFPMHVTVIWSIVIPIGIATVIVIDRSRDGEKRSRDWLYAIIALAFAAFSLATFAIMKPHSINQTSAFICLVVALIYVLMGVLFGFRYIIAGMLVAALTLAGFFLLHNHFSLWMASVGGSALILTGLWLRKP
jgi:polyferredoxin